MTILDRAQLAALAEVDPWAVLAQLRAGDPAAIDALASAFYQAAGHTNDAATSHQHAVAYQRAGYHVGASSPVDANANVQATTRTLSDAGQKLPQIAKLLTTVGDELASSTSTVQTKVSNLEADLTSIENQWTSFMQTVGHHLPPDDQDATRQGYIREAVAKVTAAGTEANTVVMNYEHTLAGAAKSMSDLGYVAPVGLQEAGEQPTAPLPVGSSPTVVATWWAGLNQAQKEYLIDHGYDTLGQLKGLPAPVLDTSNRHRLADHRTSLMNELALLRANPEVDPSGDQRAAIERQLAADNGIISELGKPGPGNPPSQTYVLAYDPQSPMGQTGVEISYGNPDTAANTGVVVPGTTHSAVDLSSVGGDGRNLYDTMTGTDKAVVVWLDGPEPQSIAPDAAFDSWADASGPRLATDLTGIRAAQVASTGSTQHLTAVGHSYGSYILGRAMTSGAPVDDVVLVGSPGVGVDHASDLGIDPSHVWDGEAGDDPILWTQRRFTPDPLTGVNPQEGDFGANHFSVDGSHGHSEYYKKNSESLHNMADIASGNYTGVEQVSAPDYHNVPELPGDLLDTGLTPVYTDAHVLQDLWHLDPGKAAGDWWNGTWEQGKNAVHVTEDVAGAAGSGAKWVWDHL